MRILPQDMDTGGFFVALLKKVAPLNARTRRRFEALQEDLDKQTAVTGTIVNANKVDVDKDDTEPKVKKAKLEDVPVEEDMEGNGVKDKIDLDDRTKIKDDNDDTKQGFVKKAFLEGKDEKKSTTIEKDNFITVPGDIFKPLKEFYGLDDENFDVGQYYVRAVGDSKVLYFITNTIKTQLIDKGIQDKVTVVNTGLKGFVRNNKDCEVRYRVAQEGVHFVAPHMKKRKFSANLKDFEMCLSAPTVQIKDFSDGFAAKIKELTMGSFVIMLEGFENDYIKKLVICCWKCRGDAINYLVTQTEIDGIRSKIRSIAQNDH